MVTGSAFLARLKRAMAGMPLFAHAGRDKLTPPPLPVPLKVIKKTGALRGVHGALLFCFCFCSVSAGNDFAVRAALARARHAHAASHVPSGTAGEHDTPTPVLMRPRGRVPTSESCVREHTPHFRCRCSSRTTRTRTKLKKNATMTTKAAWVGRNRLQ